MMLLEDGFLEREGRTLRSIICLLPCFCDPAKRNGSKLDFLGVHHLFCGHDHQFEEMLVWEEDTGSDLWENPRRTCYGYLEAEC